MSVGKMVDRMNQIVNETTSSDAIAYLPSGFTSVKNALKTLSRMKKYWKINIVTDSKMMEHLVHFEDALTVRVPQADWQHFKENILKGHKIIFTGAFDVDLGGYLKEAKDEDLATAGQELKSAIMSMVKQQPISQIDQNVQSWKSVFPTIKHNTSDKVLLKYEALDDDVKRLVQGLATTYGDDRGFLELVTSTIAERRPLGTFDIFDNHEFLIGTRIESRYELVPIAYEIFVDMAFVPREHIILTEQDVLDELAGTPGMKVAGNTVFPKGRFFKKKDFENVKVAIDDVTDKAEEEES
jgi:hypothetical protein